MKRSITELVIFHKNTILVVHAQSRSSHSKIQPPKESIHPYKFVYIIPLAHPSFPNSSSKIFWIDYHYLLVHNGKIFQSYLIISTGSYLNLNLTRLFGKP